jgi:hypothetical protein
MATATKRTVAIMMKVAGKDEGDGKGGKSGGNGYQEGNCKED